MKNSIKIFFIFFLLNLYLFSNASSNEIFKFEVSEIQITQNGNLIKGYNGGKATTNNGISIKANEFEYNKLLTSLDAYENVELEDKNRGIFISSDNITYLKNSEIITAKGNIKLKDKRNNILISADQISYYVNQKKIVAKKSVIIEDLKNNQTLKANEIIYFHNNLEIIANTDVELSDKKKDLIINTDKIKYQKKMGKIITTGKTEAIIHSKYKFNSKNVVFLENEMRISSFKKTNILDNNFTSFEVGSFDFDIINELLKATDIKIIENIRVQIDQSNKLYFETGFFDLKNRKFDATKAEINFKRNLFNRKENNPRLYGVSSKQRGEVTSLKKAVFTSCKKTDDCPVWRFEASEIKHDKLKKQISYKDAVLKIYDLPVFYFPKFFHPDPSVKRQSGFLQPNLKSSNNLGSSLSIPYFYTISDNKDLTINPILFSKNTQMLQNEYRQKNKNSSFIVDIGIVNNFKSPSTNKKKNINHLFGKFESELGLKNFSISNLNIFLERVSKDTYLKLFGDNLSDSEILPKNSDNLNSGFNIFLEDNNYSIYTGANVYEDLTKMQNDRYQYVLPFYNFSRNAIETKYGYLNFSSIGDNTLDNTNKVKTKIINDTNFKFNSHIFENLGVKSNLNFYFKNLNSLGKNVSEYKSSPQIELQSLIEFNSELPLIKISKMNNEILIPRASLRLNPGDMKNYATSERKINIGNIFDINRLGLNDTFESGNSITLGVDYKKENKNNKDNFLELKMGSVFRDNEESNIPSQSTLNQKNSNLFGSINYRASENLKIDYNFAIDDKIDKFEHNSIEIDLSLNNFVTTFNFIEEDSEIGNTNIFENTTSYKFNDANTLTFKTRRNREINLTEYYDLVYEYKNDCLTAGIRFNKTFYEDRELKPSENLMFTISFYPITSFEQSIK
ncbi:LPS assembly protein LptD [Candidatus Pelagibacter sp.]|uniref:LPS assembly protein LptD n=1 Tax=Candidatus Pelagibacter sp. TaxID=2024849 RepID=UPI003F879C98